MDRRSSQISQNSKHSDTQKTSEISEEVSSPLKPVRAAPPPPPGAKQFTEVSTAPVEVPLQSEFGDPSQFYQGYGGGRNSFIKFINNLEAYGATDYDSANYPQQTYDYSNYQAQYDQTQYDPANYSEQTQYDQTQYDPNAYAGYEQYYQVEKEIKKHLKKFSLSNYLLNLFRSLITFYYFRAMANTTQRTNPIHMTQTPANIHIIMNNNQAMKPRMILVPTTRVMINTDCKQPLSAQMTATILRLFLRDQKRILNSQKLLLLPIMIIANTITTLIQHRLIIMRL